MRCDGGNPRICRMEPSGTQCLHSEYDPVVYSPRFVPQCKQRNGLVWAYDLFKAVFWQHSVILGTTLTGWLSSLSVISNSDIIMSYLVLPNTDLLTPNGA